MSGENYSGKSENKLIFDLSRGNHLCDRFFFLFNLADTFPTIHLHEQKRLTFLTFNYVL